MTPMFAQLSLLLADIDQWRSMGTRFSGKHLKIQSEDIFGFVAVVCLLGCLLLILRFASRIEWKLKTQPRPKRLWAQLVSAHGLDRAQAKQLKTLASANGLADPSEVFVRPEVFQGGASGAVEADALAQLRQRLFGDQQG